MNDASRKDRIRGVIGRAAIHHLVLHRDFEDVFVVDGLIFSFHINSVGFITVK